MQVYRAHHLKQHCRHQFNVVFALVEMRQRLALGTVKEQSKYEAENPAERSGEGETRRGRRIEHFLQETVNLRDDVVGVAGRPSKA